MLTDDAGAQGNNPVAPGFLRRRGLADLTPRILSAIVLMSAAAVSVWRGGYVFDLIWLCAALAVGCEWQNLIAAPQPRVRGLLAAVGLVIGAYFTAKAWFAMAGIALGVSGITLGLAAGEGRRIWAFGGVFYAGLLLIAAGALHGSPEYGDRSLVWLFAIVWGTDVFAYFGGRLFGGPKLWPRISPSKTWSGTITGVLAGASFGAAVGGYGLNARAQAPLFALGLATAAVSQMGDIFESWVKRHFGAKDSSALIPGHGGFMDRLDGFIAAASFAVLAGTARGGPSIGAGLFAWT
jgi:phosphatidate cytidylyltransferase